MEKISIKTITNTLAPLLGYDWITDIDYNRVYNFIKKIEKYKSSNPLLQPPVGRHLYRGTPISDKTYDFIKDCIDNNNIKQTNLSDWYGNKTYITTSLYNYKPQRKITFWADDVENVRMMDYFSGPGNICYVTKCIDSKFILSKKYIALLREYAFEGIDDEEDREEFEKINQDFLKENIDDFTVDDPSAEDATLGYGSEFSTYILFYMEDFK
jgi:hypothetical protein